MSESVRQHRRHLLRAECTVRQGERLLSDQILDASYTGLRVRALAPPKLDEPVRVSLRVPGSRVWLEAEGTVTRLIEGRRSGDDGRSFAIRIRRMDGMQRLLLSTVAGFRPEARGGRGESRDYAKAVERIERASQDRTD